MNLKSISYLLMAVCICCSIPAYSQEETKPSHPLTGVWQMAMMMKGNDNDQFSIRCLPAFKILNADGSFYNMQIGNYSQVGRAHFNQEGTYVIETDSTYTEYIAKSPHESYEGIKSPMKYQVVPEHGILLTQYWNPDTKVWMPEMWIRVETPKKE